MIQSNNVDIITMTWADTGSSTKPVGGWKVHLGCGNEPYAEKNGPTVAFGQFQFKGGNDPTSIVIIDQTFAQCSLGLWIITHFNNDEDRELV